MSLSTAARHLLTVILVAIVTPVWAAEPRTEIGAALTQREGAFGYRMQLRHWLTALDDGFSVSGEWSQDPLLSAYAGTARHRFGGEHWGIWPLLGWRGKLDGLHGPEVGLGAEIGFGPGTASLQAEVGAVVGLNLAIGTGIRLRSHYRVLPNLDVEATYRLENWPSWTQVWGLGTSAVF